MKNAIKVVKYDTESESECSESTNSDAKMEDETDNDDIGVDDDWLPYEDDLEIPKPQRKASRKTSNVNLESHFDKKINYVNEENHVVKDHDDYDGDEDDDDGDEDDDNEDDDYDDEDDDDIDYDDGGDEDKFYISSSEEDRVISSFEDWLQTIDGTGKALRTALKHGSVLQNMLRFDPDIKISYLNLFWQKFLSRWIVHSIEQQRKSRTIKTYLGSVKHLYRFALLNNEVETLPPFPLDRIQTLEAMIGQWNKNLWKSIQKCKSLNALKNMAKFPTQDEIKIFDKSQLVQDVQQVLTDMVRSKGKAKVTRAKFTLVRDCLLCHLIFNNASRPGAIGNMTIEEFNSAVRNDGCYTVRVVNHKTDYMGPANIVFNAKRYDQSKSYLQYFRNSMTGVSTDESATFFTSWMGGKMDSSLVCTHFISFWNRVQGKTGGCINSTVVRKFTKRQFTKICQILLMILQIFCVTP